MARLRALVGMYRTNKPTIHVYGWERSRITAPAGTVCIQATNLQTIENPGPREMHSGGYWLKPWKGMPDDARSWCEVYGFYADPPDVDRVAPKRRRRADDETSHYRSES